MWVHLTMKSGNRKVGPIPVSTTEKASCPDECALKDTDCYARFGPLGMHWAKIGEGGRGDNWDAFCGRVKRFIDHQLWRHDQAGDLPKNSKGRIHKSKALRLAKAAAHTRGWTYTHYDPTNEHNADVISRMNEIGGLVVNLSADTVKQADEYVDLNIGPVTVTVPEDAENFRTENGHLVVICPAQTHDHISCDICKLCQKRDRKSIVGFRAHGTARKRLNNRLAVSQ
jgi:hypothetical protein